MQNVINTALASLTMVVTACAMGDQPGAENIEIDQLLGGTQQVKLTASDGTTNNFFGDSVAISGDTALVGQSGDLLGASFVGSGAGYVFVRSGTTWSQQAKLVTSTHATGDSCGRSVALEGDTAVVGCVRQTGTVTRQGVVYVFVRSGTSWTQQARLTASDPAADDNFGVSVAISGETLLVGAHGHNDHGADSGSAYVFVRSGTSWTQQAKIDAADAAAGDLFGVSVDLSGDTALVGAQTADPHGTDSGAAYVFVRSGSLWPQQAKLTAPDGAAGDRFGISVRLSGNTALVGSFGDDIGSVTDAGSAYVFVQSGTSWTQQAKLTANDGTASDGFGRSVVVSGDTAVVGAEADNGNKGSAYVFVRSGSSWIQQTKLQAADGVANAHFGRSLALESNTVMIGAPGDNDLGTSSGSVYVYTLALSNGDACTLDADCTSGSCVDGVCCNTTCGGGDPNDCQACSVAAGAAVDGTCGPRTAGIVCRAAAGACDVAETCDGTSLACPTDALVAPGTICRAAVDQCDQAESCTGTSPACPDDINMPDQSVCILADGTGGVCTAGVCNPASCDP